MNFLNTIGTIARGVNTANDEADRLRDEELKQADAALKALDARRGVAKERLAFDRGEAQQAIKQGDYASADTILRGAQADRNTYLGRNEVGPKLIGTPTGATIERARPTPSFQGPMPGMPEIDDNRPDYANPANRMTIERQAGYEKPKPNYEQWDPYKPVIDTSGDVPRIVRGAIPKPQDTEEAKTWDPAAGGWVYKPKTPGAVFYDKPDDPKPRKDFDENKAWGLVDSRLEASRPIAGLDASNQRIDMRSGLPLDQAWKAYEDRRQAEFTKVLGENGYRPGGGYSTPQGPQQRDPFRPPSSFNQPSRGGFRPRGVVGTGGTARWAPIVKQASEQFGVPAEIITAVMRQESGGNPNARSPVGALGLMQFMPGTAKGLGIDPLNPEQAILGGAKHLAGLYAKFGKWSDAIAAYNAGADASPARPGKRVGPFAPSASDPRYRVWENPANAGYAETRNYVKSIKADLKRQGIEISAAEAEQVAGLLDKYGLAPGATNA